MAKAETDIVHKAMMLLSKVGLKSPNRIVTFKNSRGVFETKKGQKMRCGLGPNGASDIIGYKSMIITPDMVGQRFARFMVLEGKTQDGSVQNNQNDFIAKIVEDGGIGGVFHSPEEALEIAG